MHALELLELAKRLLLDRPWHSRLLDLLPILFDLLVEFVTLAEFGLDGFELLPQEVFALRAIDVGAGLGVYLLLDRKHLEFAREQLVDLLESRYRVDGVEDRLRILHLQFQIRGGEIRETAGIFEVGDDCEHLGGDVLPEVRRALHRESDIPQKCFDSRLLRIDGRLDYRTDFRADVIALGVEDIELRTRQSLDENADPPIGEFEHPHDHRDRAGRVEVPLFRILLIEIALRNKEDHPIRGQRLLDRLDRPVARHEQGHDHERIDRYVPQRKNGELCRYLHLWVGEVRLAELAGEIINVIHGSMLSKSDSKGNAMKNAVS